jgi:Ca2+-binding RTX toxin-like protein
LPSDSIDYLSILEVKSMARIRGTNRADLLIGTRNDDQIVALSGNDRIIGSRGNDTIDGGAGTDTIDYRSLNADITLTPAGGVNKGSFGTDLLIGIERIVGNANRVNTIDASTAGAGAGMSVDLSTNTMTVDIPGIGQRVFVVENFSNIVGTNANSRMVGNDRNNSIRTGSGDDVMVGSRGNDIMDGGGGNNTVDYSNLGTAVTIQPRGTINKGAAGIDRVSNFQKIVGATNQANTVDASSADGGASLNLNLATQSMTVNIPGIGTQQFTVENFINAIGSNNSDTIVGGAANHNFSGGGGNDTINGGSGDDTINGTSEATRGVGEIDTLTGGTGLNTFVLGGAAGFHYTGGGSNDYAQINGFNLFEDTIDIGNATDYDLGFGTNGELNLFAGSNGIRDLVAKIQLAPETQFAFGAASKSSSLGGGEAIGLAASDAPLLPNLKVVSATGNAIAPLSTVLV